MLKNLGAKRSEGGGRGLNKGGPAQKRSTTAGRRPPTAPRPLVAPDRTTVGQSTVAQEPGDRGPWQVVINGCPPAAGCHLCR
jgi:hypothetical protein